MLELLRTEAMRGRILPRVDPERACALIEREPGQAADAYAVALLRLLPRALGRRVVLHRTGTEGLTFDEAWLLALLGAIADADHASARFAVASRAGTQFRRPLAFLANGLVRRLDAMGPATIS